MDFRNYTVLVAPDFAVASYIYFENPKALGISILFVYFLILLGSGINIYTIVSDKQLYTPMYFFICNLSAIDIFYTSSAALTLLAVFLVDIKTISYKACLVQMFFYHSGDLMEAVAIGIMAYDRLVAICNPLRYCAIITKNQIIMLIIFSWLFSVSLTCYLAFTAERLSVCKPVLNAPFCDFQTFVRASCINANPEIGKAAIIGFVVVFSSFAFIILSYIIITVVVIKLSTESRKQMFSTCTSHVIVIFCYFMPKIIVNFATSYGVVMTMSERFSAHVASTFGPSLVNPFVYCLRRENIRKKLVSFFKIYKTSP
ncbi:olfactory receptor 6F1-like [Polypterus senegalus]|uniref:olfactory receptor 6F1-like n=1 Tax=Polypterus senegalus TaxID=55291 RepID=UPI001964194D|nr:olfactory receptor 6F1-like [Polypterus senegalus]